jgi:hypothetical protein
MIIQKMITMITMITNYSNNEKLMIKNDTNKKKLIQNHINNAKILSKTKKQNNLYINLKFMYRWEKVS